MSVQVEPYQLRFLASRLSAGSQEMRFRGNRIESIMSELVQGSWKGEGAHAFAIKCEIMKADLQKSADVLDGAVQTLNRFANQMERVNQLRQQANMLEQQSWQYSGDSIDELHHRQNLARQAAQIRQEAEWEANAADSQAASEFQTIMSMVPQLMAQVGQYSGSTGNTGELDVLPEPLRSYYLRHRDLLQDDEGETAATLTMGSFKQTDYDGVKQYDQDHESEEETWYEKTWDWMKAEGREFVVDYKQHWKTGNIWYDEANYWLDGIPDNVKRVFHTKPFSLENWEANLELFISVVPATKAESVALDGVKVASHVAEEKTIEQEAINVETDSKVQPLKDSENEQHVTQTDTLDSRVEFDPKYATFIDSKVTVIDKAELPSWVAESYTDGYFRTVVTNEDITVYRSFGGNARAGGAFVSTLPAANRIQSKLDAALLPAWKNTRENEAVIVIPKGTVLNIGKVAPQFTDSGARLEGGVDQILLPQNWPEEWIKEIRKIPSR